MNAGIACADITPPLGITPQGHASAVPARAVLAPLEMRCIVFEENGDAVAILAVDLIGTPPELTRRMRARIGEACGIPAEGILVIASHTHCGPATLPLAGQAPDTAYGQTVEHAAEACARDAMQKLQPVTFGFGAGSAHFNVNRRPLPGGPRGFQPGSMAVNDGGIVDRRARVLRVDDASGQPSAILFHFSCHPTTIDGGAGLISPDYPGLARARIEAAAGCPALFLPGCFGNVRPRMVDDEGGFRRATQTELREAAGQLADSVLRTVRGIRTGAQAGLAGRIEEVTIPYGQPMPDEDLAGYATDEADGIVAVIMRDWARRVQALVRDHALPESEAADMQMLGIGRLAVAAIPGEPVQEIGHAIEADLAGHPRFDEIWPCGYANDLVGYLCTARHHGEGGYEPTAYPYFARPLPFADEESVLREGARRLLHPPSVRHDE